MPKKCDSCRHHGSYTYSVGTSSSIGSRSFQQTVEICKNDLVLTRDERNLFPDRHGTPLDLVLQRCNPNNGTRFTYFEPKTPAAGAFVEITREVISDAANVMVASGMLASDQLTNETKVEVLKQMAAAG